MKLFLLAHNKMFFFIFYVKVYKCRLSYENKKKNRKYNIHWYLCIMDKLDIVKVWKIVNLCYKVKTYPWITSYWWWQRLK